MHLRIRAAASWVWLIALCSCVQSNIDFGKRGVATAEPPSSGPPTPRGTGGTAPVVPANPQGGMPATPPAMATSDAGTTTEPEPPQLDAGALPDSSIPAPPSENFSEPGLVAALSFPGADDNDPSLTADRLELFFMSERGGGRDIWHSSRSSVTASWESPSPLSTLNTSGQDTNPVISPDGLTLYYSSNPAGSRDVFVTTRPNRSQSFGGGSPISELNSGVDEFHLGVTPDGLEGILTRIGNSSRYNLFRTTRASLSDPWGLPVKLNEAINTDNNSETSGLIVGGGLSLYFSRERSGVGTLYRARRPSPTEAFGPPVPLNELESGERDANAWVSENERHIVFSSNRSGDFELYEATR